MRPFAIPQIGRGADPVGAPGQIVRTTAGTYSLTHPTGLDGWFWFVLIGRGQNGHIRQFEDEFGNVDGYRSSGFGGGLAYGEVWWPGAETLDVVLPTDPFGGQVTFTDSVPPTASALLRTQSGTALVTVTRTVTFNTAPARLRSTASYSGGFGANTTGFNDGAGAAGYSSDGTNGQAFSSTNLGGNGTGLLGSEAGGGEGTEATAAGGNYGGGGGAGATFGAGGAAAFRLMFGADGRSYPNNALDA